MRESTLSPLVSPAELQALLGEPDLLVLDIRSGPAAREAFEAGHVPGAVHSDYAADPWRVKVAGAPGLLPDEKTLSSLFGRLGLTPDTRVVVVSAGGAPTDVAAAARVYWTFKVAGHPRVALLDGGHAAWVADPGRPVETGPSRRPAPTQVRVRIDPGLRSDVEATRETIASRSATPLDARAEAFFTGREKAPEARVGGRLPGAVNADYARAVDPARPGLKQGEALRQAYAHVPEGPIVSYCNTGHSAALNWFVLSELLGRRDVRLFDGSMTQWTQDPSRPVETG